MSRFHVGGRVMKTVLAVTLAIFIAQQLGLKDVGVAAIVAVVTVQRTFYHSLLLSMAKMGSIIIGVLLGSLYGHLFGLTPLSYGLITFTIIIIFLQLHWQDNIIVACVTAIAVVFSGADSPILYSLERVLTAVIGGATALTMNYLFTPNHREEVTERLYKAEADLGKAIDLINSEILNPGGDDAEFRELVTRLQIDIEEGLEMSKLLREEQRFIISRETPSDLFRQAFFTFASQLDRIKEMHELAGRMPVQVPQAFPVVKLLRIIQKLQHNKIRGKKASYASIDSIIANMDRYYEAEKLPRTRKEFASRASLFHLLQEVKRYYRRTVNLPVIPLQKPEGR